MRAPASSGTIERVSGLRTLVVLLLTGLLVLAAPVTAGADDGDEADIRVTRSCTARSTVRLRVRTRDDDELRVDYTSAPHGADGLERRRWCTSGGSPCARRGEPDASSGDLSRRLTIPDWPGRDTVTVRALGPGGEVCRASATISGG